VRSRALAALVLPLLGCPAAPVARPIAPTAPAGPLAIVPSDTPYVVRIALGPLFAIGDFSTHVTLRRLGELLAKLRELDGPPRVMVEALIAAGAGPWPGLPRRLGLSPDAAVTVYGLDQWPVVRLELADPAPLRAVLARLLADPAAQLRPGTRDGRDYATFDVGGRRVVVAILAAEAVVAVLPIDRVAAALPSVLGLTRPAAGLTLRALDPTLRQLPPLIGRLDLRRALVLAAPDLAAAAPELWRACTDDVHHLATLAPSLVAEYLAYDDREVHVRARIALARPLRDELAGLRGALPPPTVGDAPSYELAAAVDVDATRRWLLEAIERLDHSPSSCAQVAQLRTSLTAMRPSLTFALPPLATGIRGVEASVDGLDLLSRKVHGTFTVVTTQAKTLAELALTSIPAFHGLRLDPDGAPVELPLQGLGLDGPGYLAALDDRLVLGIGAETVGPVGARIAAPLAVHPPLLRISYDFRARPADATTDEFIRNLGLLTLGLDVDDHGLVLDWIERP
jgi:hypothetical protein